MKKGFTLIELLVSITLLAVVLIFMVSLLIKLNEKKEINTEDAAIVLDQAIISKKINSDVINFKGIKKAECEDLICTIIFKNGDERKIKIINNNKSLSYETDAHTELSKTLPEGYLFQDIKLYKETYQNGSLTKIVVSVKDNPKYNIEVYYYGT